MCANCMCACMWHERVWALLNRDWVGRIWRFFCLFVCFCWWLIAIGEDSVKALPVSPPSMWRVPNIIYCAAVHCSKARLTDCCQLRVAKMTYKHINAPSASTGNRMKCVYMTYVLEYCYFSAQILLFFIIAESHCYFGGIFWLWRYTLFRLPCEFSTLWNCSPFEFRSSKLPCGQSITTLVIHINIMNVPKNDEKKSQAESY